MANKIEKKVKKKKGSSKVEQIVSITPFHSGGFWKENWLKALILFVLPILMYFKAVDFGYVLDDQIVITDNNFTKKGFGGIGDLLTTESMQGYFGEQKNLVQGNRYRPLSLITFAAEHGINNGQNPQMSHIINILLYGFTGLLLFRVLSMMFRKNVNSRWWLAIPFLTSALYILHPIHSEAVANIKGRDEIMAMFFSIATLYATLRYVDKRSVLWLISSCVLFFLGLLSKENAITFLAVIPMTIYFFSNYKFKTIVYATVPLLLTTIAYLVLRFSVAGIPDFNQEIPDLMNNPFLGMTGGEKNATILFSLLKYLQLFIFPHPLSHDYYPYAIPMMSWADPRALLSLFVHVGLLVWAFRGLKSKRVYSYAILYYFATLSIASNIVINLGTFMNERFIYMASMGLSLLMVWILSEKLGKSFNGKGAIAATAIVGILTVGYFAKTIERVPAWESAMALNTSAVKHGTNSARANSFMATALYQKAQEPIKRDEKQKNLEDALFYAEKALRIYPTYMNGNLMKAGISADLYKMDKDEKKLLQRFSEVMSARPDVEYLNTYLEFLEPRTNDLDYLLDWYAKTAYENVLLKADQSSWALHYLNRAYNLDDKNKKVLETLSKVYDASGDKEKAQYYYNLSLSGR